MENTLKKINLGCGEKKFPNYINVDMVKETDPDVVCDFRFNPLPFEPDSIDEVSMLHCLEHIEYGRWGNVFITSWDVLKPGGKFVLCYPEFEKCAKYYVENYRGNRDFWRVALYGRQAYPGDYHVVPVSTAQLICILQVCGFYNFKSCPETPEQDYATFLVCEKGPRKTKEEMFKDVLFQEVSK